jgi:hypothetical protein
LDEASRQMVDSECPSTVRQSDPFRFIEAQNGPALRPAALDLDSCAADT